MDKSIEIILANGYTVFIDNNDESGILVGLINPNGYIVSDRTLNQEEAEQLKAIIP